MTTPTKTVNVLTLGCSKNTVDSETLMGLLRKNNIQLADEADGADAVIINTCGFIDVAKEESVNTILQAAAMKRDGRIGNLYVAGCLSQRYMDDLEEEIPEVDAYFGVTDFTNILRTINPNLKYDLISDRYVPPGTRSAYLKISEGCNNPCSFCAIPLMRGGHVSRPMEEILIEANHLAMNGVKELVVVAQDSTYYGLDIYGERRLAGLLEKLAQVRGIEWVRLMYAYPSRFPLDILPVIASQPTICKYIDMPVQHVSDSVLKSMRRGHTRRALRELIGKIREEVPGITLRTTLIIGYPNEGEAEFQELLDFVAETEFDRLGVFAYSQEENTTAHPLNDPIPAEIKQERIDRVMQLQREISAKKHEGLVGKREKVFVESVAEGEYICRSERDAPEVDGEVYVTSNFPLQPGDFVEVEYTGAMDYDLFAESVGDGPIAGASAATPTHALNLSLPVIQ
ncbi:MAG: 30S ribosomal protein S12 methylthiotransferase RimO [Chlorobi bacterium]|jgi:ribosomal protein S12 methylthiotransferase|nr:30S ribosomal protein S12 methylthiotransferase RimO [Chlorobiota bacterium]